MDASTLRFTAADMTLTTENGGDRSQTRVDNLTDELVTDIFVMLYCGGPSLLHPLSQ